MSPLHEVESESSENPVLKALAYLLCGLTLKKMQSAEGSFAMLALQGKVISRLCHRTLLRYNFGVHTLCPGDLIIAESR
jgi:hypothetical protein